MPLEGRWHVFVCSGCGECTGRHGACDALRVRTPVVPVDDAAVERAAEALFGNGILDEIAASSDGDGRDCWDDAESIVKAVLRAAGEQP